MGCIVSKLFLDFYIFFIFTRPLSLSLLDFIHNEMSVRQSLRLDIDLCVSDCDSSK